MWKRKASNITHERNDVPGIGDIPVVLWDTLRSYCNNATTIGNLAQFFTPNENILNYKWTKAQLRREFTEQHAITPEFWSWVQEFGWVSGGSVLRALLPNLFVNERWPVEKSDIDVFVPHDLAVEAIKAYEKRFIPDEKAIQIFPGDYLHVSEIYNVFWGPRKVQIIGVKVKYVPELTLMELAQKSSGSTIPKAKEQSKNKKTTWTWIKDHFDFDILKVAFDGESLRGCWTLDHSRGITKLVKQHNPLVARGRADVENVYRFLKYRRRGLVIQTPRSDRGSRPTWLPLELQDRIYIPFYGSATGSGSIVSCRSNTDWITPRLMEKVIEQQIQLVPILLDCQDCENQDQKPWLEYCPSPGETIPVYSYRLTPYCTKHVRCKDMARDFYNFTYVCSFKWMMLHGDFGK